MVTIIPIRNARFDLGELIITPAAEEALEKAGQDLSFFLQKHAAGDWGDLDTEDKASNERALPHGRVMSSYKTLLSETVWLISEWQGDIRTTTALLPSDY
jgi:hypothetical protein